MKYKISQYAKLENVTYRTIEVINTQNSDRDDLTRDFVSIITSFTTRLYGQRRSKRNTEKLIRELDLDND